MYIDFPVISSTVFLKPVFSWSFDILSRYATGMHVPNLEQRNANEYIRYVAFILMAVYTD